MPDFGIDVKLDSKAAARGLDEVESKLKASDRAAKKLRNELSGVAAAFGKLGKAVNIKTNFERNLRNATAAGRTLQQELSPIPTKMRDIGDAGVSAASRIRVAFAALGIGLAVGRAIKSINRLSELQNQLRIVTDGTENLKEVTGELFEIANRTRVGFVATARTYSRMALATRELGVSQKQTGQFVESLNKAVILSGATAREAEAGMLQLSQGLASGALRGDELRSVLEQLPVVADVIAKHLGVTRGELRKLGADGKISATHVIDAFAAAKDTLDRDFGETVPTIAQSIVLLGNKMLELLSRFDEATGFTNKFGAAIKFLIDNSNVLLKVLKFLTIVIGVKLTVAILDRALGALVAMATAIWTKTIPAIHAFSAALRANPIGAFASALVVVIGLAITFSDELSALADTVREAAEENRGLASAIGVLIPGYAARTAASKKWRDQVRKEIDAMNESRQAIINRQANDEVAAAARDEHLVKLNKMVQATGKMTEALHLEKEEIGLTRQALVALRTERKLNKEELESGLPLEFAYRQYIINLALEVDKLREAEEKRKSGRKKASSDRKALVAALRGLIGSLNDVTAATIELTDKERILTRARKAGLITDEQHVKISARINEQLRDRLQPIQAIEKALREELRLQFLSNIERAKEIKLQEALSSLKDSYGREILPEEVAGIKALIGLYSKLGEIQKWLAAQEKARLKIAKDRQTALDKERARLAQLRSDFESDMRNKQTEIGLRNLELQGRNSLAAALRVRNDLAEKGLFLSDQEVQKLTTLNEKLASNAEMYGFLRDAGVDAFGQLRDTLIDFLVTGEDKWEEFAKSFIKWLAEMSLKLLLFQALQAGMSAGGFGGPNLAANLAGFAHGGRFQVGGHGGTDSQLVAFRASPDETVSITKPNQQPLAASTAMPAPNVSVTNVVGDAELARGIDSSHGETALLNRMSRNPGLFRRALGVE